MKGSIEAWNTYPNGDWSHQGNSVGIHAGVRRAILATGSEFVGVVVQNGVADATNSRQGQSGCDTGHRTISDVEVTQEGIQPVVEDGGKRDDTERVEVADDIVRDAVRGQHGRQKARRVAQSVVIDVLDGEEAKDAGRLECAADILHKLVIPMSPNVLSLRCDDGRLGRVPEAMASNAQDTAATEADAQYTADIEQVTAARGVEHETFTQPELADN